MAYKFKPKKAVAKRFKVSKTGKLKRGHSFTSHLMSARSANKRRKLRRPAILFEGHARNMRQMMGISHLNPAREAHERALEEQAAGGAEASEKQKPGTQQKPSAGRQQRDKSRSTK